ncbi:hypothetical protein EVJ58_g1006 [Rhodofomes roseus]|uniref:Uncharacterized protein n=1 Tax=Rhodofomes roseus TaxID=34475 RepID=A0A4Y9Z0Y3_9APHY|nr:hypothetical protein EVJ58_g1006 [Rhodofomes roseus]
MFINTPESASEARTRLFGNANTYGPKKDLTNPGTGGKPDDGGVCMIVYTRKVVGGW